MDKNRTSFILRLRSGDSKCVTTMGTRVRCQSVEREKYSFTPYKLTIIPIHTWEHYSYYNNNQDFLNIHYQINVLWQSVFIAIVLIWFCNLNILVDEKIFCCHGGLSPDLQSMEQIRRIMRPTDVPDQGLLCDLLWSDPDKVIILIYIVDLDRILKKNPP